ncbi:hypothetical protein AC4HA13_0026 [Escherichia phage vB_EcoM_4HA13]|uniref:Uncharacterized protein n=1 Tax=Escherichia phage vB_EcoM_4HA13 TaxID=2601675 RepID=A0A7D0JAB4_9CAUD|nr:hypothetical protein HYP96_gp26 [Escherichia phage vB_EcoM_4HA13]QEM42997.1 hypothetical protein AC4HA13_0026 [Escherichia phage vB_EcoM_4HA13]
MIRKHSARVIKAKNVHTGEIEAYALIGGVYFLAGWEKSYKNPGFSFIGLNDETASLFEERVKYSASFLEYSFGKSIKQLLSKSFIHEWTTKQEVYGVPF